MKYKIQQMQKSDADDISTWKYQKPYSIYDMDGSDELKSELMNGSYYSAYINEDLYGYFCFGRSAQVPAGNSVGAYSDKGYLDVGLGMKPKFCDKGMGKIFFEEGLKFALEEFSQNRFRLTVATFNKRAIKVYEKIGFKRNSITFVNESNKDRVEFIIMILKEFNYN